MVKDYRNRKRPWIKGVIQDRLGRVTHRVMVGDLFWKRHVDQLRSLAGSKVAETETMAETPKDDYAYPEVVAVQQPERPLSETSATQTDLNDFPPNPRNMPTLVPAPAPVAPDLSTAPQPQIPEVTKTEEPAEIPVSKRYQTRVRSKPKRLIEEM